MRILYITPEYITEKGASAGLGNYLHKITSLLNNNGHKPVVVVASHENKVICSHGIEIHRVKVSSFMIFFLKILNRMTFYKFLKFHYWTYQSKKLNIYVRERMHLLMPDVIQYSSYTATSFFNSFKCPSIVRISGYQALWEVGFGLPLDHPYVRQVKRIEDKAFQNCDLLIGPSKTIASVVSDETGREVSIVRSPLIDFPEATSSCNNKYSNLRYILFFGSLNRIKGADLLAEAMVDILKDFSDIHLVFAGKDMKYKREMMSDYIRKTLVDSEERVHILGSVEKSQLMYLITESFLVVLPSRIDNYPNACVEAMQLGALVLGSRGASFEEIIRDTINGFLFDVGDLDSLGVQIRKILTTDPSYLKRIRCIAKKEYMINEYNKQSLKMHEDAYSGLFATLYVMSLILFPF